MAIDDSLERARLHPDVLKNLAKNKKLKVSEAYSEDNPPPYPVTSVNGQTGAVTIPVRTEVVSVETAFAIPASGASVSYDLDGITSDHELTRWNFSSSAENQPPVDLQWDTYDGYFTITNTSGTTSESIRPVFVLPTALAATTH